MQIALSAKNEAEVLIIPVVPAGIRWPVKTRKSETFSTASGDLTLIGAPSLRKASWESRFPSGKKSYTDPRAGTDPYAYIEQIQKWLDEKIPIRIISTSKAGKTLLNMACTIDPDGLDYEVLKNGDIAYSIKLTEYIFVTARTV